MNSIAHKAGFVVMAILVMTNLALLPVLVSASVKDANTQSGNLGFQSDSPNVVTRIAARGIDNLNTALANMGSSLNGMSATISRAGHTTMPRTDWVGKTASRSGVLVRHSVASMSRSTVLGLATGLSESMVFAGNIPGAIVGTVASSSLTDSVLRPATNEQVPIIDPSIVLAAVVLPSATPQNSPQPSDQTVTWPIHGIITTRFGVPEPPYQPIHTGIDISDGERSGVTPIHPFKAGTVVQVIHERIKLGNEVIVDNGGGLTSVYGHMHSTSVTVGQQVTTSSVLGTEGSTGVSTGPHVHFEIRLNGVPVNPMHYIPGRP